MAHILIIGQGLSAVSAALQLKQLISDEDWITVVSYEKCGVIKSFLPFISVGLRSLQDVQVEFAPILERYGIHHVQASLTALYPERQIVVLESGQRLPFDYLIIADGGAPAYDQIPGLSSSHDRIHTLASQDQTIRAEVGFQDFLNQPGPLTVSLAPGASEYQNAYQYVFNVDRLLRHFRIRDKVPIQFVTPEPFLGHFGIGGIGNSQKLFESAFRSRQVSWVCNAAIDRIDDRAVHILSFDDDGLPRGRKQFETQYGVLWPALRCLPFFNEVDGLLNDRGLIEVNQFLQAKNYPNIFAFGELAMSTVSEATPMEAPQPCSDFLRESMTGAVVGNLAEVIRHRYPLYEPTGNGFFMIDFGHRGVALLAAPQRPPRNTDRIIEGRLVHVVKRGMERYQLRRLRAGVTDPVFERLIFRLMRMPLIKQKAA